MEQIQIATQGNILIKLKKAGMDFTDQANIPQWVKEAINAPSAAGLIVGYNDCTFRSDGTITRAEIAVIIARVLNAKSEVAVAF